MAAFTATITEQIAISGLTSSSEHSYTGEMMPNYGPTSIADAVTDRPLDIAIDVSEVTFFYALASVAMTLETNATDATGGNTLVLQAGKPYIWRTGDYDTFKLTLDVARIYVTNASGAAGTLTIRGAANPA